MDTKIIHGLIGRTIVDAATDDETMSIRLDDGSILQIAFIASTGTLHHEIEFSLCSQGIHSWCDSTEVFPVDYKCEWCGEEYGHVVAEEAAAQEEQTLDYFNKYIAGDR